MNKNVSFYEQNLGGLFMQILNFRGVILFNNMYKEKKW